MPLRVLLAVAGGGLAVYGVIRLLADVTASQPLWLLVWLAGALIVHDGVIAPLTLGLGGLLARVLPTRGLRSVQFALVWIGLMAAVALPLIVRRGSQPAVKALDDQDYLANLALLAVVATGVAILGYTVESLRGRRGQRETATNARPSTRHESADE
ncbi:MAG: hypothetical protein ACTHMS_20440 [Jatrophihabitans sp.]|uniref:hypothetical protein n=1 Tax=Jatrophihabitans sp. TaxID=1932789 RepID=UPI003F7FAE8F